MYVDCVLQTRFLKILNLQFDKKTQSSICFETRSRDFQTLVRAFQTLDQAFEALRENQRLRQVLKELCREFVLQHGPYCPNQPRY